MGVKEGERGGEGSRNGRDRPARPCRGQVSALELGLRRDVRTGQGRVRNGGQDNLWGWGPGIGVFRNAPPVILCTSRAGNHRCDGNQVPDWKPKGQDWSPTQKQARVPGEPSEFSEQVIPSPRKTGLDALEAPPSSNVLGSQRSCLPCELRCRPARDHSPAAPHSGEVSHRKGDAGLAPERQQGLS